MTKGKIRRRSIGPVNVGILIGFYSGGRYDIALVMAASVLLFVFMFTGKNRKLDRWEGALLLGVFAAYMVFLFLNR